MLPTPFGNGTLCVGVGSTGIARLDAVSENEGALSQQVDTDDPPFPAATIAKGTSWVFQAWYRDAATGGAGFNLSHAVDGSF